MTTPPSSLLLLLFSISVSVNSFDIYWNAPTKECQPYLYFNLSAYGIIQNSNDSFGGDRFNILYNPGVFPRFLKTGNQVNGGIPQRGNLKKHLAVLRRDIENRIPPGYSGPAVIDFEDWQTTLQSTGVLLYRNISRNYFQHARRFRRELRTSSASQLFEHAGRQFLEKTLQTAAEARPKALWGYYHYPYCKNYKAGHPKCAVPVHNDNKKARWLFQNSKALYPSTYLVKGRFSSYDSFIQTNGIIDEAIEMTEPVGGRPIYSYIWFGYHGDHNAKMALSDLVATMAPPIIRGMAGVAIWGSSENVATRERCGQLMEYVQSTLGPFTRWLSSRSGEELNSLQKHLSSGRESFDATVRRIEDYMINNKKYYIS